MILYIGFDAQTRISKGVNTHGAVMTTKQVIDSGSLYTK